MSEGTVAIMEPLGSLAGGVVSGDPLVTARRFKVPLCNPSMDDVYMAANTRVGVMPTFLIKIYHLKSSVNLFVFGIKYLPESLFYANTTKPQLECWFVLRSRHAREVTTHGIRGRDVTRAFAVNAS